MNRDLARQSFEQWYNAEYIRPIIPADRTEGGYQHPDAQAAWDAWQAALSHAEGEAQPVAWGLKWPEDVGVNPHTVFRSEAHAQAYRAGCQSADTIMVVPLYTHPAPQVAVPEAKGLDALTDREDKLMAAGWNECLATILAAAPTAPAGEPVVFPEPQEATTIEEYVGEYEYTDGEGHNYSPTETERALILDAIHGIPDHLLQPPKPAQQPVSDPDGSSNSSRALLDQIIEELEGGFVACSSCGDQEDTATLDVMDDLRRLRFLLADAGNRAAPAPDERGIAERTCEWSTDDEWDDDNWESECGASWTFPDGGPAENGMKFRPKCGAKIRLRAGKGDE